MEVVAAGEVETGSSGSWSAEAGMPEAWGGEVWKEFLRMPKRDCQSFPGLGLQGHPYFSAAPAWSLNLASSSEMSGSSEEEYGCVGHESSVEDS